MIFKSINIVQIEKAHVIVEKCSTNKKGNKYPTTMLKGYSRIL